MMEKSAQPGEGVGCTPFTISSITYKVVVYTPSESADTLSLFLLYPYMYSVICTSTQREERPAREGALITERGEGFMEPNKTTAKIMGLFLIIHLRRDPCTSYPVLRGEKGSKKTP
jgi:hypothetical protein